MAIVLAWDSSEIDVLVTQLPDSLCTDAYAGPDLGNAIALGQSSRDVVSFIGRHAAFTGPFGD